MCGLTIDEAGNLRQRAHPFRKISPADPDFWPQRWKATLDASNELHRDASLNERSKFVELITSEVRRAKEI